MNLSSSCLRRCTIFFWVLSAQCFSAVPPTVRITSPTLDSYFPANRYVQFQGFATDDQGREISITALRWSSSIDGSLGYGQRVFAVLSPGYHTIRLTARDNAGTTAAATTLIRVGMCDSPVARKITTTADISDFLLDEKRGNVIVINRAANRVEFYNIATGASAGVVPVGSNPMDGDLTLDGNQLLVANYNSTFVSIVDLNTQSVIGTIPAAEGRRPRQILAMSNSLAFLFTAAEAIGSPPWGGSWQIANLVTRTSVKVGPDDIAVTGHYWHAGPGPYFYGSQDGFSPGGVGLWQLTTTTISMVGSEYIVYGLPQGGQKLISNPQGTRIVLGSELRARDFQLLGDLGLSRDYYKCFDRTGRHVLGVKGSNTTLSVIDGDNQMEFDGVALPTGESLTGDLIVSADNRTLFARTNSGISVVQMRSAANPADLAVQSFAVGKSPIAYGSPIPFAGKIRNLGGVASPCDFWVEFKCSPNANFSPPVYYLCDSLGVAGTFGPGASLDLSTVSRNAFGRAQLPPGYYYVRVSVDSPSILFERNEGNNSATVGPILIGAATAVRAWEGYQ